jgi:antitoxin ParD1/3/4
MTTINISLPEAMTLFIQSQIAQGNYSTVSEYIEHLIAREQQKATKEKIEPMLLSGLDSGEPIIPTDDWWEKKRTEMLEKVAQV